MSNQASVIEILGHFPNVQVQAIDCLGNAGGFSGACLWKIRSAAGTLCLRKWPRTHPTEAELENIHAVLQQAASRGLAVLPVPLLHGGGGTVLKHHRDLYELTPWLPGQADFRTSPNPARLTAAITVLARFHLAVRADTDVADDGHQLSGHQLGSHQLGPRDAPGPRDARGLLQSPGLIQRQATLHRLLHGDFDRLAAAVAVHPDKAIGERGRRLLEMFPSCSRKVAPLLGRAASLRVTLQPCIRDIWHDHVLFTGDEVTGLIDFGAMRTENVACDLARLIGSLVGDDQGQWSTALSIYQAHRPLTADELLLVRAFDQSGVLMSGLNWLQWICVEGTTFDDRRQVLRRLDDNLRRVEFLYSYARGGC